MATPLKLSALLETLTPSEKRYLNLWLESAKTEKKKSNSRLTKARNGKKTPGEKTKEPSGNDFEQYHRTLRAMRNYHDSTTPGKRLREGISTVEFLLGKRLYDQGLYEIRKLKELATGFDRYTALIELLMLEQTILIEKETKNIIPLIDKNKQEQNEAKGLLLQLIRMNQLKQEAFVLSRLRNSLRKDNIVAQVKQILSQPELMEDHSRSFQLQHLYWHTHAICAICTGEAEHAARCYEHDLALWQRHPQRLKEESIIYKLMLSNYLSVCHSKGDLEKVPELTARIESIPCRNTEEEAEQFQNIYFVRLLHRMNTDDFHGFEDFAKKIDEGMLRYRTKLNKARELMFYYNLSIAYFAMENWEESLNWLSRIINSEKTDHRQDIQAFARVFRMVLYYELGKGDLLEYDFINTERYLRQRKLWFAYEASVVKFVKKLTGAEAEKRKILFHRFLEQLREVTIGERKSVLPGYVELQLWAKHHSSGQSIRSLLHNEARKEY